PGRRRLRREAVQRRGARRADPGRHAAVAARNAGRPPARRRRRGRPGPPPRGDRFSAHPDEPQRVAPAGAVPRQRGPNPPPPRDPDPRLGARVPRRDRLPAAVDRAAPPQARYPAVGGGRDPHDPGPGLRLRPEGPASPDAVAPPAARAPRPPARRRGRRLAAPHPGAATRSALVSARSKTRQKETDDRGEGTRSSVV